VKSLLHFMIKEKHTHETSRVGRVSPNLVVDLNQALHDDRKDLLAGQGILQPVAEEDGEGKGFTKLVGTRGGTGSLQPR
jgi:hypothetical protein